jgi:hypothetical protein
MSKLSGLSRGIPRKSSHEQNYLRTDSKVAILRLYLAQCRVLEGRRKAILPGWPKTSWPDLFRPRTSMQLPCSN